MDITKGKVCDRITTQSKAILNYIKINMSCKLQFTVKQSSYRPGVAQRVPGS